jgi:hypothetical protein
VTLRSSPCSAGAGRTKRYGKGSFSGRKFGFPGVKVASHSGQRTRLKSMRRSSAGAISCPHSGQGVVSEALTFSRLIFPRAGMVRFYRPKCALPCQCRVPQTGSCRQGHRSRGRKNRFVFCHQKRKRPRLIESWDARSNSPPPKSAHHHHTILLALAEWPEWATQEVKPPEPCFQNVTITDRGRDTSYPVGDQRWSSLPRQLGLCR